MSNLHNAIKKHKISYTLIIIILVITAYMLNGLVQQSLILTVYDITCSTVSEQLDGYKIAHVSDFHSGLFSETTTEIVKMIAEQNPNIICLTGDIVDSKTLDYESVEILISGLTGIAPVFAVSGNNETSKPSIYEKMIEIYRKHGVQFIDGKSITKYDRDAVLTISGIKDAGNDSINIESELMLLNNSYTKEGFGIILYHRANEFDRIVKSRYDLVLSGHIHGGIVRFPLIGGLLSPDNELFPSYSGGLYEKNGVYLVSNRGIGDNYPIPRIYNPPEVVIVVLHAKDDSYN